MGRMRKFDLFSYDHLRLSGCDWPSDYYPDSASAVIVLLHGLAEHSGRYEHVAEFYNRNDIALVSMDLRGHGLSDGRHVFIPTMEAMFQDIDLLIAETQRRYPSCPMILYGHSMGGTLALSYTLNRYPNRSDKCPYQAMVVTSPWIRLARSLQPPNLLNSMIRKASRIHPSLKFPLFFNSGIISRNEEIVTAYSTDPRIRRSATLSLTRTIGHMATMLDRSVCTFHIPVVIQHGSGDSLTSADASSKFASRGKNIQFRSWPGCYHELYNEPERVQIFHFTLAWINEKLFT